MLQGILHKNQCNEHPFRRYLAPTGSLKLTEKAWNCSDYCRTVITNPGYMKENFTLKIETMCVPDDRGDLENVHELSADQLKVRIMNLGSFQVHLQGYH